MGTDEEVVWISGILALLLVNTMGGCGKAEPLPIEPDKVRLEYESNPVAADAKYEGKLVQVSGKVADIRPNLGLPEIITGLPSGPSVIVESFEYGEREVWADTICFFENEEDIVSLHKGAPVIIAGTFGGFWEGASRIYLRDSHIVKE